METLSQAINRLSSLGYTENISHNNLIKLNPKEWAIDEIVRFEGRSNPADNSILYAISHKRDSRKALVVNAYGVYGDSEINDFIRSIMRIN